MRKKSTQPKFTTKTLWKDKPFIGHAPCKRLKQEIREPLQHLPLSTVSVVPGELIPIDIKKLGRFSNPGHPVMPVARQETTSSAQASS
jgi:hypothetical protein